MPDDQETVGIFLVRSNPNAEFPIEFPKCLFIFINGLSQRVLSSTASSAFLSQNEGLGAFLS